MSRQITLFQDSSQGTMQGTIFRKQIVRFGKYVDPWDPQDSMILDEAWAKEIIKNFKAKVIDRVPVPLNHTDDVSANTGELIKLEIDKDGLYGYLDIRDPKTVTDIENGLIFDNSISWDPDYVDTEDGKHWGPVMLHVALVNNPYLSHMKGFEAVNDAVAEFAHRVLEPLGLAKSNANSAIMLSESKVKELRTMKLSKVTNDKAYQVTIKVKGDDDLEVEKVLGAGEEIEVPAEQEEAVKKQIADAVDPEADDKGGDDDKGDDDNAGDDNGGDDGGSDDNDDDEEEDTETKQQLSRANAKIRKYEAEKQYEKLLSAGKIVPAQKEAFIALANSEVASTSIQLSKDAKPVSLAKAVATILEAGPQIVKFSEDGSGKGEDQDENSDKDKKPSEKLSDADRAGLQAVGAKPERMDELAEKYPDMKNTLEQLDTKGKGDK